MGKERQEERRGQVFLNKDKGDLAVYQSEDGALRVEARVVGETVWLSMAQIAELFGVNVPAVSKHIKNIHDSNELKRRATVSKMETVRREGKRQVTRTVEHYNLDMIISVGYRDSSFANDSTKINVEQIFKLLSPKTEVKSL